MPPYQPIIVLLHVLGGTVMATTPSNVGFNFALGLMQNPLDPTVAAQRCIELNVRSLKMFDHDITTIATLVSAYSAAGITDLMLMVAVPNGELASMAADPAVATSLVAALAPYASSIGYIAVGNEPLASWYSGSYDSTIVPAATNMQNALTAASSPMRMTVPFQLGCISNSYPPQSGTFSSSCTKRD